MIYCSDCGTRWTSGEAPGIGPVCEKCGNDGFIPRETLMRIRDLERIMHLCYDEAHPDTQEKIRDYMNKGYKQVYRAECSACCEKNQRIKSLMELVESYKTVIKDMEGK